MNQKPVTSYKERSAARRCAIANSSALCGHALWIDEENGAVCCLGAGNFRAMPPVNTPTAYAIGDFFLP